MSAHATKPLQSKAPVIEDERHCPECDYDLRGLRLGGRCPECGTRITLGSSTVSTLRLADHLRSFTALDALVPFIFGATGLGLFVFNITLNATALAAPSQMLTINLILSGLWLAGVLVLIRAHARDTKNSRGVFDEWNPHLRLLAGVTQLLMPVLVLVFHEHLKAPSTVLYWTIFVLFIAVAAGWPAISLMLAAYADGFGDSHLGHRYRACAWVLSVFGVLSLIVIFLGWINSGFSWMIRSFGWMVVAVWVGAFVVMNFSNLLLANSFRWAFICARAIRARDDRLRARAEQEKGNTLPPPPVGLDGDPVLLKQIEEFNAPDPDADAAKPAYWRAHDESVIDPTTETPYKLEDDGPSRS
ncbi:MAG TPA: hypothetical protein VG797_07410 [Phycisphaerales bacterium]|nr:hypothetical protein [Phycisphaerales bacterium]